MHGIMRKQAKEKDSLKDASRVRSREEEAKRKDDNKRNARTGVGVETLSLWLMHLAFIRHWEAFLSFQLNFYERKWKKGKKKKKPSTSKMMQE